MHGYRKFCNKIYQVSYLTGVSAFIYFWVQLMLDRGPKVYFEITMGPEVIPYADVTDSEYHRHPSTCSES